MPLNNINLMGPNPAQPFDIQTQQAQLAQAQKIADLLMAQGMKTEEPTTPAGAGLVMANWGAPVGNMLAGQIGQARQQEIQGKQAGLAQQYQQGLAEEAKQILDMRQQDYTGAVKQALSSRYPEIRKLGDEMEKGMVDPKTAMQYSQHYSPESAAAFYKNPSAGLQPPKKLEFSNGMMVQSQAGEPLGMRPMENFAPVQPGSAGMPPTQQRIETGEVKGISGGNVTPASTRENLVAGADVEQLKQGRADAVAAQEGLANIYQVKAELEHIPADKFGTLSGFRNNVMKLGELLGATPKQSTAGVEGINAYMGQLMLQDIRKLAPVTKEDVAIIQGIIGSTAMTKDALTQVLQYLEDRNGRVLQRHEAFVRGFQNAPGVDPGFAERWIPKFQMQVRPQGPRSAGLEQTDYSKMSDDEIRAAIEAARGGPR